MAGKLAQRRRNRLNSGVLMSIRAQWGPPIPVFVGEYIHRFDQCPGSQSAEVIRIKPQGAQFGPGFGPAT